MKADCCDREWNDETRAPAIDIKSLGTMMTEHNVRFLVEGVAEKLCFGFYSRMRSRRGFVHIRRFDSLNEREKEEFRRIARVIVAHRCKPVERIVNALCHEYGYPLNDENMRGFFHARIKESGIK